VRRQLLSRTLAGPRRSPTRTAKLSGVFCSIPTRTCLRIRARLDRRAEPRPPRAARSAAPAWPPTTSTSTTPAAPRRAGHSSTQSCGSCATATRSGSLTATGLAPSKPAARALNGRWTPARAHRRAPSSRRSLSLVPHPRRIDFRAAVLSELGLHGIRGAGDRRAPARGRSHRSARFTPAPAIAPTSAIVSANEWRVQALNPTTDLRPQHRRSPGWSNVPITRWLPASLALS